MTESRASRARIRGGRPAFGILIATALGAATLATAACGSTSGTPQADGTTSAIQMKSALHDRLPADIRSRGTIRVVTDASYPPMESFAPDGQTIVGADADLADAVGQVLGVDISFRNEDFAGLADLVAGGQADMVISAMTDTADRETKLDFVNYLSAGTAIVVQRGNPHSISDIADLCGHTVAVETGTTQQDLLDRRQAKCAKKIDVIDRPTNDDALVLLRTGRAVAILMDFPPAELLTTDPATHSQYELATTTQFEPGLYGIGFAKNRTALRDAVRDALAQLASDGVYRRILAKWNVEPGAVDSISINAAGGS